MGDNPEDTDSTNKVLFLLPIKAKRYLKTDYYTRP